jgi:hypothetical protein
MTENTGSILGFAMDDIPSLHLVDAGEEHMLEIVKAEVVSKKDTTDQFNLKLLFAFVNDELAKEIMHYIPIPDASLEDEDLRKFVDMTERFKALFNALAVAPDASPADIIGEQCTALVGYDDSNPAYPAKNTIQRFVERR